MAKPSHIDSTRLALLSMNEVNTEYWNSYDLEFVYKYFVTLNIEILGIKLKR